MPRSHHAPPRIQTTIRLTEAQALTCQGARGCVTLSATPALVPDFSCLEGINDERLRTTEGPEHRTAVACHPGGGLRALCADGQDRKSTRLNSSHLVISYAVFCLKKKQQLPVCVSV